jgi:hypothetical protein
MRDVSLGEILKSYGDFDGALVLKIEFSTGVHVSERTVSIELKVFSDVEKPGWQIIRLSTLGRSLFGWCELPWDTNLVLNYPVKLLREDGYEIIDFDPLHAKESGRGIALSSYFIGGKELRIKEISE